MIVLPLQLPLPNKLGLIMAGPLYNLTEHILVNTIMALQNNDCHHKSHE